MLFRAASCLVAASLLLAAPARAGLTQTSQFNANVGALVGLAYDHTDDTVWVYDSFGSALRHYSAAGVFLGSIPRPGESADDFDLEIAPEAFALNNAALAEGTLLAINGESGVAEIYALDKTTGAIITTLTTAFGNSHVVGGSWHPGRNTFFLVQDRQPGSTAERSLVGEIDPITGAVLNTFKTDVSLPGFTVNFGDVEVSTATGNLHVVSSDESTVGEFTPAGVAVQQLTLPGTVGSLSGIGLRDASGGAWVSNSSGLVSHIAGFGWSNLGFGLFGVNGVPLLMGTGTQIAGAPSTLAVKDARPLAATTLIVGFTQLNAPFKGGVLVPAPDKLVVGLVTDGAGAFTLPFAWPAGLPSGFALHYQCWISDPVGPKGLSATNGLRSVTP
jgi:hypothetical protein